MLGAGRPQSARSHFVLQGLTPSGPCTVPLAPQARVTANGRVGATAAVYTAAILGEFRVHKDNIEQCAGLAGHGRATLLIATTPHHQSLACPVVFPLPLRVLLRRVPDC